MRASATQYWRDYNDSVVTWVSSRLDSSDAPLRAAGAAERWLSDYPEQAADIQRLTLGAAALAIHREEWEAARRLATVGLDAALIRPLSTAEDLASATQLCLFAASAATALDDGLSARVLLERASDSLERMDAYGALTNYLLFQRHALAGELAEASLEDSRAAQEFSSALELGEPLRSNRRLASELETSWGPFLFGETAAQQASASRDLLWKAFNKIFRNVLLGRARTAGDAAAAREAMTTCANDGLPVGLPLLVLHRIILNVPADELDALVAPCIDQAQRLEEPQRSAWTIALCASQASAHVSRSRFDRAAAAFSVASSANPRKADAIAFSLWFSAQVTLRYGQGDAVAARDALDALLQIYTTTSERLAGGPIQLPFRVACEPAFAAGIEDAFKRCEVGADPEARRDLVVLLDASREPGDSRAIPFNFRGPVSQALEKAADKLTRLTHALRRRPDTMALILQSVGTNALFVCATNDATEPLIFARGGPDVRDSMQVLARAAQAAVRAGPERAEELKELGKSAFNTLPMNVRARVSGSKTILLVPDFSAGQENLPFELLHDGHEFLGLGKVVTRCLSVARAVAIAEPEVLPQAVPRRALCVAVPTAPGLESLRFAATEAQDVANALRTSGWDVEALRSEEATQQAVIAVAPLTGILHTATHGDAAAGAEGLVLADGARLGAIEVMRSRQVLRGVIFLNACSLAQARYLGGGVSRGMAYAFARAGAPSVISNLLAVEDRSAAFLALEFYKGTQKHSVGEALRRAREAAAVEGVNAALWSASVLVGNPFLRTDSLADTNMDATCRLLVDVEIPPTRRLTAARAALKRDPTDSRLAAAIAWVEALRSPVEEKTLAQMARAAREIGHFVGEAHCLQLQVDAQRRSNDQNARAIALRELVTALGRLRTYWPPAYQAHRKAEDELRALDPTYEPHTLPTVRLKSGLTINDRSDPAVAALLDMQAAMDEHEQRWRGEPSLRAPERTVPDAAWNAVVWGYRSGLYGTGGEASYAGQMAARLVWRELVPAAAQRNLRRILGGILPFLWGQQRKTHLDFWLAQAQAKVISLAIESASRQWVPPETSSAAPLAVEALAKIEEALTTDKEVSSSKYARARAALAATQPPAALLSRLDAMFESLITRCQREHPEATGDFAAWTMGLVAEQTSATSRTGRTDQAIALRTVSDALERNAEGWLMKYLELGFQETRETGGQDLLARWSMAEL